MHVVFFVDLGMILLKTSYMHAQLTVCITRAFLSPKNIFVDNFKDAMLRRLPGFERMFRQHYRSHLNHSGFLPER